MIHRQPIWRLGNLRTGQFASLWADQVWLVSRCTDWLVTGQLHRQTNSQSVKYRLVNLRKQ